MKHKKIIAVCICILTMMLALCAGCAQKGKLVISENKTNKAIGCGIEEIVFSTVCTYLKCNADSITKPIKKGAFIGFVVNSDEIDDFREADPKTSYFEDKTNTTYNPCDNNRVPIYIIDGYVDDRYMFLELDEGSQRIYFSRGITAAIALLVNLSDSFIFKDVEYVKCHDILNPTDIGDEKLGYVVNENEYEFYRQLYPDDYITTYKPLDYGGSAGCFDVCSVEGYEIEQYICVYIFNGSYYVYKNPAYQANQN